VQKQAGMLVCPMVTSESAIGDRRAAWDHSARWVHMLLLGLASAGLSAAMLLTPGSEPGHVAWLGDDLEMACSLRAAFGIPCWACGMTRAFVFGIRGRLAEAWAFQPAGVFLLGVVLAQIPWRVARLRWPGRLPGGLRAELALAGLGLVAVAVVWALRLGGVLLALPV